MSKPPIDIWSQALDAADNLISEYKLSQTPKCYGSISEALNKGEEDPTTWNCCLCRLYESCKA